MHTCGMTLDGVPLTDDDLALVEAARAVIKANYEYERHHVGAAVRMGDGSIFTGVHLEAHIGRIAVCAEAVAIGTAQSSGAREVKAVVAVVHPHDGTDEPWVASPCGMCRELISDYGPQAEVILPNENGSLVKVAVLSLLPAKYTRDAR